MYLIHWTLLVIILSLCSSIRIPLDNLTDPLTQRNYHIQLDFGNKHTVLPFRSKNLDLMTHSIHIPTILANYSSSIVKIGLEHPSDFINAICKTFKV